MNKSLTLKVVTLFLGVSFLLPIPAARAQLADTIWAGNATVTVPSLTQYKNGRPLPYPKTISNLSFIIPIEVWFWDSSKFLVVFRQKDFGADPTRAPLQPAFGEWIIPTGARRGNLAAQAVVPYGSDLFEIQTGRYSLRGIAGTFTAENRDTRDRTGYDRDWIYRGYRNLITGSFRLNGRTLSVSGTSVVRPNPGGPNKFKGGATTATATLTRTARKPTVVGVEVFDDANY